MSQSGYKRVSILQQKNLDFYKKSLEFFKNKNLQNTTILHNIKTPLTSALLCSNDDKKTLQALLLEIKNILNNCQKSQPFNLNQEINKSLLVINSQLQKYSIKTTINVNKNISITGNACKLRQIVLNLVQNSINAYLVCPSNSVYKSTLNTAIIKINAYTLNNYVTVEITDYAGGFTSKSIKGTGIKGTEYLLKKHFNSQLIIKSKTSVGTQALFTLKL